MYLFLVVRLRMNSSLLLWAVRSMAVLGLMLAWMCLPISAQQPKKSKAYLKMTAAFESQDYSNAYKHATDALKKDETDYTIYLTRGYSALFLEKYKQGLEDAEMAINLYPGYYDCIFLKGLCLDGLEQTLEIEPQAKQALRDYPARYEPPFLLFRVAYLKRDLAAAETYLLQSIQKDSSYASLFSHLAELYLEMDRPKDALSAIQKATKRLGTIDANLLSLQLKANCALERYPQAITDLRKAQKMKYPIERYESNMVELFHLTNQRDSSKVYLKAFLAKYPDEVEVQKFAYTYHFKWKEYDRCLSLANNLIQKDSLNAYNYSRKGWLMYVSRNDGQGLAEFNRAIALKPESSTFYAYRALYYAKYFQYDKAEADNQRATQIYANDFSLLNTYAYINNLLGRYQAAIDSATRSLQLNDEQPYAYNNRGYANGKLGKTDSAFRDFERSLALDSANAYLFSNRGQIYYDLKQYDHAAKDYQQALQLDSNLVEVYFRLARLTFAQGQPKAAFQYLDQALNKLPIYNDVIALRAIFYLEQKHPEKACATWQMAKDQPFMYLDFQKEATERFKNVCKP
jgi:tetratricopeptide (TPR) repeat protein